MNSSVEYIGERRVLNGEVAPRGGANRYPSPLRPVVPEPRGRGYEPRAESAGSNQGNPQMKRRRTDSWNQAGPSTSRSGNGRGTSERPLYEVPETNRRSSIQGVQRESGRRSESGDQEQRRDGGRVRNWSPARSPGRLDRSRPRDRDLREELTQMRGRGRGGRSRSARGTRRWTPTNNRESREEERRERSRSRAPGGRRW